MTTVERDTMIVNDYLENRPMVAICREYALSERRIFQILKARGVRIQRKRRAPGDPVNPLSKIHQTIGSRLYDFYFVKKGMDRAGAATRMGVTDTTLRRMELGAYNFSLFDLQDITHFLGVSVGDLVDGR